MPLITLSGKVTPKLFIILYERDGLSNSLISKMFQTPNLIVTWTTSGKMAYPTYEEFLEKVCLGQMAGARNLLLLDSLPCHKDKRQTLEKVLEKTNSEKTKLHVEILPGGGTSSVQP
jgi:hypothetical protein